MKAIAEQLAAGKVHDLKSQPPWFHQVWDGTKPFEYRKDDRSFVVGDRVRLNEYDLDRGLFDPERFTGRRVEARVVSILRNAEAIGLPLGYAVLGLADVRCFDAGEETPTRRDYMRGGDWGVVARVPLNKVRTSQDLMVTTILEQTVTADDEPVVVVPHGRNTRAFPAERLLAGPFVYRADARSARRDWCKAHEVRRVSFAEVLGADDDDGSN